MKWFNNLKVGGRLILGFSVMILFIGIIGLVGYRSAKNINQRLDDIFSVRLPSINYLIQADRDLQQLLVAERSMIFANSKSELFRQLVAEYEENLAQADERWEKYKALSSTAEENAVLPKYEAARNEWKQISRTVVDGRKADTRQGRREALDFTLGPAKDKFENMRDYIDQLTEINLGLAKEARDAAADTYRNTVIMIVMATGIGLLLGVLLTWGMNRGITRPLRRIIDGLTESANQVASGSGQVAISSQALAEGSAEQAASLEETSSSLEEMSSMTRQNADNATQADNLMHEASQIVGTANDSMVNLTASMEKITKASDETSKIIKTIDEIAFQTNLLALNAAVEAARAGEAGAGFAVVADEVRNLAMRAADAAKNTAGLIEGTIKQVKEGSALVNGTNEAFTEVATSASKVGELVAEIAAASKEQAQGIDQVNKAVGEIDKVVQGVAANAEESASASEEMSAQAEQMKGIVRKLVDMVGEHESHGQLSQHASARPIKSGNTGAGNIIQRALAAPKKVIASSKGQGEKPEPVIPMEEGEFEDF